MKKSLNTAYYDYTSQYLCGTPFSVYRGWPYIPVIILFPLSIFNVIITSIMLHTKETMIYVLKINLCFFLMTLLLILLSYYSIHAKQVTLWIEKERKRSYEGLSVDCEDQIESDDYERRENEEIRNDIDPFTGLPNIKTSASYIKRAVTSKMIHALVYFIVVIMWTMYGSFISISISSNNIKETENEEYDNNNGSPMYGNLLCFEGSLHILIATMTITILSLSYVSFLYNHVLYRCCTFIVQLFILVMFPTYSNVIGSLSWVEATVRVILFFFVYTIIEMETRTMVTQWVKYKHLLIENNIGKSLSSRMKSNGNIGGALSKSEAIPGIPWEIVNTPILELDTETKQKIYVSFRSLYQSIYILFGSIPILVLLIISFIHISYLIYSMWTTIKDSEYNANKKFDIDTRITSKVYGTHNNDKESDSLLIIERKHVSDMGDELLSADTRDRRINQYDTHKYINSEVPVYDIPQDLNLVDHQRQIQHQQQHFPIRHKQDEYHARYGQYPRVSSYNQYRDPRYQPVDRRLYEDHIRESRKDYVIIKHEDQSFDVNIKKDINQSPFERVSSEVMEHEYDCNVQTEKDIVNDKMRDDAKSILPPVKKSSALLNPFEKHTINTQKKTSYRGRPTKLLRRGPSTRSVIVRGGRNMRVNRVTSRRLPLRRQPHNSKGPLSTK